jgi:hypothetical protein
MQVMKRVYDHIYILKDRFWVGMHIKFLKKYKEWK